MYLARLNLRNFRQFGDGEDQLEISFRPGLTALVGRNDSGKSAVVDAIRYALLTRDQSYIRVQPEDFFIDAAGDQADEIVIRAELKDLGDDEKGAFAEYLSYDGEDVSLIITWSARRRSEAPSARRWVDVAVRSGPDGTGPALEASARELLASAYLRPLRDAAREMSSGRGSRLSQILASVEEIKEGEGFDETAPPANAEAARALSLLGWADYLRYGVKGHEGIKGAEKAINDDYLASLLLSGDSLRGKIDLTDGGSETLRLRQILERLELGLLDSSTSAARGSYGLGSNNVLYMACELLLLSREPEGLPLLLIEEPEAHLHPQRQLRLMDFLLTACAGKQAEASRPVQVILTTHSPNLASSVPLGNVVILEGGRAFPMASGETKLSEGDYGFLERFLDVTKANLFFCNGVIVVEGAAEALLLPTVARLLGRDLTKHGVSVVNVGGTGLRRFSTIYQRADDSAPWMSVPVACITDMDVMPDCAPAILGYVESDDDDKWQSPRRRWRALRDFGNGEASQEEDLNERRAQLRSADGQTVRTFVSDHWTLEYDLAFAGLAEQVYVAAALARDDEAISKGTKSRDGCASAASAEFAEMETELGADRAALCSRIYEVFHSGRASKAVAAQRLAEWLEEFGAREGSDRATVEAKLPGYIVEAITHVTGGTDAAAPAAPAAPAGTGEAGDA